MKRTIFAVLLVSLLIGLASLIPNNPSTAYPPDSTPIPPTYLEPMWFGVYCLYPGTIPPYNGYIRVKWDNTFPDGYVMDTVNPGRVTIYSPSVGYTHYSLRIVENNVSHWWGTTWSPSYGETAEITGYVRLRRIGSTSGVSFPINPNYWYQHCYEPNVYLPLMMK